MNKTMPVALALAAIVPVLAIAQEAAPAATGEVAQEAAPATQKDAPAATPAVEEEYYDMFTGKKWTPDSKWTIEQLKARDERVLRKTGGFLHLPAEGPLAMVVDMRAKARQTIDEVARLYTLGTKLAMRVEKDPRGEAAPLAAARAKMAAESPLMLIAVVDGDPDLPALSVFPEERIGIVNADRLRREHEDDPSAPEMRVSKEIWRAIGFIGGIGFSAQENDMMQPYYTLEEIDANNHPYIQPMNMAKMAALWKRFGVKRERRIPYFKAVKEGWAPAPTNEYQRAIWDANAAEKKAGQDAQESKN